MTDKETALSLLTMRAITDADTLMPLCWRGLAIFPDGLGSVLAAALENEPEVAAQSPRNREQRGARHLGGHAGRARRSGPHRLEARQRRAVLQIKGPAGGLPRLAYTLDPMIPCASALLGGRWITNLSDWRRRSMPSRRRRRMPICLNRGSPPSSARARNACWTAEVQALGNDGDPADRVLVTLRLLTELQNRFHPAVMKGVTAWIAAAFPTVGGAVEEPGTPGSGGRATEDAGRVGVSAADPDPVAGSGGTCRGPGRIARPHVPNWRRSTPSCTG